MAYFNHAWQDCHLGTHASIAHSGTQVGIQHGYILDAGVLTANLWNPNSPYGMGPGTYGIFDAKTNQSLHTATMDGRLIYIASAALYSNDNISPFLGGYLESHKTKIINPKYVSDFWGVAPCTPQNHVVNIGHTPYTNGESPAVASCLMDFYCNQTYSFAIQAQGSPALKYLLHQAYAQINVNTGCCTVENTPNIVDSTVVMINLAAQILNNAYLSPFMVPVVYGEDGNLYYAPGTVGASHTWDQYVSTGHTAGHHAGVILYGAYYQTVFKNCTWQPTDYYETEPIQIYVSMVDLGGDPCAFTGICVQTECYARQGMGFGDTVLHALVLSESYLQNFMATDLRIREVTQGDQVVSLITRTNQYYSYFIRHSVPRKDNPTSQLDNDQYVIQIVTTMQTTAVAETFVTDFNAWLLAGGSMVVFSETICPTCSPTTTFLAPPSSTANFASPSYQQLGGNYNS